MNQIFNRRKDDEGYPANMGKLIELDGQGSIADGFTPNHVVSELQPSSLPLQTEMPERMPLSRSPLYQDNKPNN